MTRLLLLGVLALWFLVAACELSTSTTTPASTFQPAPTLPPPTPTPTTMTGTLELPALRIAPVPSNLPDYNRDDWTHWIDVDGDCQNTRHEVLIAESITPVTFTNSSGCAVASGQWIGPFTGTVVNTAGELDVDHMVPLANAHRSGGWAWSTTEKRVFANDLSYPGHLNAVTASANRSKGSRGPEAWRPPDERSWCQYAADWATIKDNWGLIVTIAESEALQVMLDTCPYRFDVLIFVDATPSASTPQVPPTPTPVGDDSGLTYDPFGPDRNCGDFLGWLAAQAFYESAGGPASDPHRLDADRDGIACEALPGAP